MAVVMGMQAENLQREHRGEAMAYTEKDFNKVMKDRGLHHNAILSTFYPK